MKLGRTLPRCAFALSALLAFDATAFAQSATCRALQNQLAALGHVGGGRAAAYANAAQRQIDEIQRISAYMRQLGCGGSGFFIFGPSQPPQCGALATRLSRMQANLASLEGQAERLGYGPGTAARRDQLVAAIRQYCSVDPRQGLPPYQAPFEPEPGMGDEPGQAAGPPDEQGGGLGPGKPVCVRLCDGYFFPLASAGKDGRAQEMCQAQCPGTETEAFVMGSGDDITRAVGQGGKSYMELDNALRYQKARVAGCSCRKADESWGQALKGAEDMLGGPDAPISADEAARLSRPVAPSSPKKGAGGASAKGQPAAPTVIEAAPAPGGEDAEAPRAPLRAGVGPDGQPKVRIITPAPPKNP